MAPSALAGTAGATSCAGAARDCVRLTYDAAAGEVNNVSFDAIEGNAENVTITDATAPVVAGTGCAGLDEHRVVCPVASRVQMAVSLGDGNDVLRGLAESVSAPDTPAADLRLDGGPGDDILGGGPSKETLVGGAGNDALLAGAGDDVLIGDGDGGKGTDLLDGGAGTDVAAYPGAPAVTVDLARSTPQGQAGEGDVFQSIESAQGGDGADHLTAAPGGSTLTGGPGADRLDGAAGRDNLVGGEGNDRLDGRGFSDFLAGGPGADLEMGGAGNDHFEDFKAPRASPGPKRFICGAGTDTVEVFKAPDFIDQSCEKLGQDSQDKPTLIQTLPLRSATGRIVRLGHRLSCHGRCLSATVRSGGATLGSTRISASGKRSDPGLRLSAGGAKRLKARRRLEVAITFHVSRATYSYRTLLRTP